MHCWVSTGMGDHLWVGKLSRNVTGHLGQLSLLFHPFGVGNLSTDLSGWG